MFYLLKFTHEKKDYLLYQGDSFIGGNGELQARDEIVRNTGKSLSIGGFSVIQVQDIEHLKTLVSEYPFKIIHFSGGIGIPFEGVLLK